MASVRHLTAGRAIDVRETLRRVGPKLFASMLQEKFTRRLNRYHLAKVDQIASAIMRRILGDPLTVELDGLRIQGPFDSRWMLARLKGGLYEPFETSLFKGVVRPGMIVLDIGANVGLYSLMASRLVGAEGIVYAFEPDPRNGHYLRVNAAMNGCTNIQQFNVAVFDGPGKHIFRMAAKPFNSSMFLSMGDTPITATVEVETVAIDDILPDEGRIVDVIKMDVEGGEPAALQGMTATLRANPEVKMFVEFEPPAIEAAGRSPEDFLKSLQSQFEDVFVIDERRRQLVPLSDAALVATQSLYCSRAKAP